MTASTDTYHVHIEHHAAVPAALAEAQRALLDQQASRGARRAGRARCGAYRG